MSNTKITFSEVKVGDIVRITIEDCGIGTALVLTKDKHFMTVNIDRDSFTPCYDCQSLGSSLMDVHEDEIHEIILIRKEENNMSKTTELKNALEIMKTLEANQKISDEGYLDKKALRKALEPFEFGFNNRTTRKEMVQCLAAFIKEQQDIADEIAYGNITVEQPQQKPAQQQQTKAQQKTKAFIKKLKEAAVANEKKGYGYTVSAFMFQATVLSVHNGLEKLQGHKITAEEAEKTEKVYDWCVKKGIISQVLYSINEKSFIRVYTDKYDGKKESKDFWYMTVNEALKAGYTIKECTSYKVNLK